MKIGLGTVQFGLAYGVSNRVGKTPIQEVKAILDLARDAGVSVLDTAPAYGDSETVLGSVLPRSNAFKIVTKTPAADSAPAAVEKSLRASLGKLGVDGVHGMLVHTVEDLLGPGGDALFTVLSAARERGWTAKIGVSVYNGAQAESVVERFPIDLIQLPMNVLDQRLWQAGHLARIKGKGIEIHVRSAFLQGLLLMDPQAMHGYFDPIKPFFKRYTAFLEERGLTPLRAALGFVTGIPEVDSVVCGVNDSAQFRTILENAGPLDPEIFKAFSLSEESFINPSLWRLA